MEEEVDTGLDFLTLLMHEGDWRWTDGTGITGYEKWRSGQPNNHEGNQHCGAILKLNYYGSNYNAEWNDERCSLTLDYICEKWPFYTLIWYAPLKLACLCGVLGRVVQSWVKLAQGYCEICNWFQSWKLEKQIQFYSFFLKCDVWML